MDLLQPFLDGAAFAPDAAAQPAPAADPQPAGGSLADDLAQSIARRELTLLYQPRVDLATMQTVSVEALLRWRRADGDTIMPGDFIPVAEASGLITAIGDWVLEAAARQAALWRHLGQSLKVAVNVSPVQIETASFSTKVVQALRRHGLDPADIELEVTESMPAADTLAAGRVMRRLDRVGISLAIDDFGSGFAGIATLQWLPAKVIKFDRSVIARVDSDSRQTAIVAGLVALARSVGAVSIAEGVETKAQMEALKALGCDQVQGFLLSGPVPWRSVGMGFCWLVGEDYEDRGVAA